MTDTSKYVVLDEIDHILLRPDTYIGSTEPKTVNTYIFDEVGVAPTFREVTYSPALLKIFDEILQNCYDHSKRPEGKHLNKIVVDVNPLTAEISVFDNAGIPVVKHPEIGEYIPCIIFGMLRSGSNYNDDEQREGGGRNGFGSKLVAAFSSSFKVETCDGKNKYEKLYENNKRKESEPIITKGRSKGTRITFTPDYGTLKCYLDRDNYGMIITRIYEIAACAPNIEVTVNGQKLNVQGFKDFVSQFGDDYLYTENENWRIGLHHSGKLDGFSHISFCNATHTWLGGTHTDYIIDQVVDGIRSHIKKKTKQDVKPADIKNHFLLMVDCTVYNPRFSSQTKEHMNLAIKDFGTSFRFDDAFFKKLIKSDIVKEIIEWAENRKKLQDMADLKKMNKEASKTSNKTIPKYEPASQRNNREECILFLAEGDSAANPLISARDPKKHSVFALRGKPLNMVDAKMDAIKKNEEIKNLMAILGLEFGKPATDLRYGKIIVSVDPDPDGNHIFALIINNLQHYWSDMLKGESSIIYKLNTPIVRVTQGKDKHEFFSMEDYEKWFSAKKAGKIEVEYLKGLGSNTTEDFEKYMHDDTYHIQVCVEDMDDVDSLKLAFGEASVKKEWLSLEEDNESK